MGEKLVEEISKKLNINATLINPRYITGLDEKMLEELKQNHNLILTLEDGILDGGFGEKITRYYGTSDVKVKNYGIKKAFYDRYDVTKLLKDNGITIENIILDIEKVI